MDSGCPSDLGKVGVMKSELGCKREKEVGKFGGYAASPDNGCRGEMPRNSQAGSLRYQGRGAKMSRNRALTAKSLSLCSPTYFVKVIYG